MSHTTAISGLSFGTFGDMLRYLRRRAGLQQRDLAIAVGYSESQICRLEQNRRLPDMTTLAARFLPALDLEGDSELAARLLTLAAAARGERADTRDTPAAQPAPGLDRAPSNLPAPLTTLIDRADAVAAVRASLTRPDVRLLTLVGPPGIGKTRLGLQAARELQGQFAHGACFVALAVVRDPALVLQTVAHALSIKMRASQPIAESLRSALRDRQILLVLDNLEQLLDAAPDIAELLRLAPGLKIIATSRAPLRLSGEHLFVVPALDLPDLRKLPPAEQVERYPAIQLFVDRVRAVQPGFRVTAENAAAIVEICARLDALPLAIELAAARSRLFDPQALLDRLRGVTGTTALQFLVDGPRDLLAHQRTLRGTIDWSYDLLDPAEQRLFAELAVFVGGCRAEAAEAVTASNVSTLERSTVLDGLLSLVDKSLLRHEIGAGGEPRFVMLETIREYAREKLEAGGQAGAARGRHAAYYFAQAQAAAREPSGARQERWIDWLEEEYNNLWAALEWYAAEDPQAGLSLATSLRHFWHARGYLSEGRRWLEQLLAACGELKIESAESRKPTAEQACSIHSSGLSIGHALCAAGFLAYHQGDLPPAVELSARALAVGRERGDTRVVADALYNLGGVAFLQNEYARSAGLFDECIALYRELGAQPEVALVLKNLGLIAKDRGDFARATALYQESLAIRHALGDRRGVAQMLFSLGVVAYWQGDYARSAELSRQSVAIYRALGDRMGMAYALDNLAMAANRGGQHAQAAGFLEESLLTFRALGDQVGIAMVLADLGEVGLARGERAAAERWYVEALSCSWRVGDKRRVAFCLEGLAAATQARDWARSAILYGAAEALREALGTPLPPAERSEYSRVVAIARAAARDDAAFQAFWRRGRRMTLEKAVAYAHAQLVAG